jgi:WD40-like Beta Propeller Repeat
LPVSPLREEQRRDVRAARTPVLSGAAIFALLLMASPLRAASLFDPALRFRALPTDHFVIYFHQGTEPLARRLAAIAEETWHTVRQSLRLEPPRLTHVVLVDQTDVAGGTATPIPYDTVVVTTAWPAGYEFIGDLDDWLRLVFTHEFTHIVHLDRSEGWARGIRRLFGRVPIGFPNLFLPGWQIEGLATYQESVLTGEGRMHDGNFLAIVREAARTRSLEPLDRVNGGLTDWPGGNAPYAYGLGFHQYLADRFGADRLSELAGATAGRVPYTASRVFRRVFGEPLGVLWKDYQQSLLDRAPPVTADTDIVRLTYHGFTVGGPRFDRFACETCPASNSESGNRNSELVRARRSPIPNSKFGTPTSIVYSVRNPHGFPALNRLFLDDDRRLPTGALHPQQLTTRYFGSTTAIGREELIFDQQEIHRNVAVYSDLYSLSRATGRVRRLTSGARLLDPDLSPDGQTLAAVQARAGQRNLVLVRLKSDTAAETRSVGVAANAVNQSVPVETLIAEPETQFNTPRWSPDGRLLAVERHQPGGLSQIVIVDVTTKAVRIVTPDAGVRAVSPAWRPDGQAIVAAAAPRDQPFNLWEIAVDGSLSTRRLTATTGGAIWPDVSPDGKTIVFVGYTNDGFDVFLAPYPAAIAGTAVPGSQPPPPARPRPIDRRVPDPPPYSPWPTLRPTSWAPIVEGDSSQFRLGAATGGADVLGYHAYSAAATWLVSGPAGAERRATANPDWNISYAYDRWRPTLWAAASTATSFLSGPPTAAGTPSNATLRERRIEAGVLVPVRHVRVSHLAMLSLSAGVDEFTFGNRTLARDRRAVRGAWATTSARVYGYSVSPEHGATAGVTAERVPRAFGSFGEATTLTADARAYLTGFGRHHVVAVRGAAGVSTGELAVRRTFLLGGALPNTSVVSQGRHAISLLRGFATDTFAGNRVALVNADYRWPLARPQRGAGTWPLLLHTLHAAAFADAGHAWTDRFRASALKTSIGAELSADVVAGYFLRFTATIGAARGHDGSGTVRDRSTIYARIGRAF